MSLDPISAILNIGSKVIDRLWPDPTQAAAAKLELFKLQQSGELQRLQTLFLLHLERYNLPLEMLGMILVR